MSASPSDSTGLGDLRAVSRKNWSRSMDDLGKFTPATDPSPSAPQTQAKINAYLSPSPTSPSLSHVPFPSSSSGSPPEHTLFVPSESTPTVSFGAGHIRSISHAPHPVSTKHSLPAIATRAPPLPRKGVVVDKERDRAPNSAGPFTGFTGFPFHFGGNAKGAATTPEKLTPPTAQPSSTSNRTSQIVHHSGFINKHQGPAQLTGASLGKASSWKPFKAEIKGAKMSFYKPPSDRSRETSDLFPDCIVPDVEEDQPPDTPQEKEREEVKRKRAFWGPGRHPEMKVNQKGEITGGSLEALIYEMVFGTSFFDSEDKQDEEGWKRFGSAILLTLPELIGPGKFEPEFIRFASRLIQMAEDSTREKDRGRVEWLAREYIRHRGSASDVKEWEAFHSEYIPNPTLPPLPPSISMTSTRSASTPATLTMSTRPTGSDKFSTIGSAFNFPTSQSAAELGRGGNCHAAALATLRNDTLTREAFMNLDVDKTVKSLTIYHRGILEQGRFSASEVISDCTGSGAMLGGFGGTHARPHWLTRLVLRFIVDHGSGEATTASGQPLSRTYVRAKTISRWVEIAEKCRLAGDECSWRAIFEGVCSQPVARLEKVWRRVDTSVRAAVESWARDGRNGEVKKGRITPWFGDAVDRIKELLDKTPSLAIKDGFDVPPMLEIATKVAFIVERRDSCLKEGAFEETDSEVLDLQPVWAEHARVPSSKPQPGISHYLSMSYMAEPRQRGRYSPFFWKSRPTNQSTHPLLPLLFPEPLPTITFLDVNQIVRTKKESLDRSAALVALDEAQVRKVTRMKSFPESRPRSLDLSGNKDLKLLGGSSDLGETAIHLFDGELVLKIAREPTSRPVSSVEASAVVGGGSGLQRKPSQGPSVRVSPAAAALERKTSSARRSSLPSISQRTSLLVPDISISSEPPLRVVVAAGTLDRLVDILINGLDGVSVSVADDNGEMPLREGKTRAVKIDRLAYSKLWFSVFRAFMTPLALFELLRKSFFTASSPLPFSEHVTIARGRTDDTNRSPAVDYSQIARGRLDILTVINEWVTFGNGAQDALDDSELLDAMESFLSDERVHAIPQEVAGKEGDEAAWAELEDSRKCLLSTFIAEVLRPHLPSPPVQQASKGSSSRHFGTEPPIIDEIGAEDLVDSLDSIGTTAYLNVTQEDLLAAADLLEVQTADRTGWYLEHDPSSLFDEVEIPTIYSHFQEVDVSPLISELSNDTFYKLLPPSIRGIVRAHAIAQKWLVSKIAAPGLGIRARQARIELLLQAVEICRLRSGDLEHPPDAPVDKPVPRSFVETVIVSALLSPESRIYYRAWQNVASKRRVAMDTISSFFAVRTVSPTTQGQLTVDMGWLLERMAEIISMPDTSLSSPPASNNLVNFDKRRTLYNLIANAPSMAPTRSPKQHADIDHRDSDRLNNMLREAAGIDFKAVKEDAHRENNAVVGQSSSGKRNLRPFQKLVWAQQEKIKRDKQLRERLIREKKMEQQRSDRREQDLNKAMNPGKQQGTRPKHQKGKSMNVFLRAVRPLSTAFTGPLYGNVDSPTVRRSATELDFVPNSKPAIVVNLVSARVAVLHNDQRSFVFQLHTEDGGHFILQAATKSEMTAWMQAITKIAHTAAQKRLTYTGNEQKPQLDFGQPKPVGVHPSLVFGVELDFLIRRENGDNPDVMAVPRVIDTLLSHIESRGLAEVGIYRIPAAVSAINAMKDAFDHGVPVDFTNDQFLDIYVACDVVKLWLRSLPDSVIPQTWYYAALQAFRTPEYNARLSAVRDFVHSLPHSSFALLRRLMEHLDRVTDYEEHNQMTTGSLAIVFSPNLLRSPGGRGLAFNDLGQTTGLVSLLISQVHWIFGDIEADGEEENEETEDEQVFEDALEDVQEEESEEPPAPAGKGNVALLDHDLDTESLSDSIANATNGTLISHSKSAPLERPSV